MILVSDIFGICQRVLGTADTSVAYDYINRAIRLLRNKASSSNVTWDPSLIYCNIETDPSRYIVSLPYQIEKPIAINLNSTPSFTRGQLFEFTMNGPGSNDPLVGFQWMDQGTKPLQVPLPFKGASPSPGNKLLFTSDNPSDVAVVFQCLVQLLDNSETIIPITLGTWSNAVQDLLAVNKPVTAGNITVTAGSTVVALYPPSVTNPRFHQIKISQPGASVRILGRRRYIAVANTTDFIPLESGEAVIQMVKAVKYYDEDQISAAQACEATAVGWLQEENAARMLYSIAGAAMQVPTILNLNIFNRDSIIVGDVYEEACKVFGNIGQVQIFDKITTVVETLQNMSQWDPLIGYVDIQSFGGPDGHQFYLTLPRYVETPLAISINGRPAQFASKWFEFNMNGLHQDNFDGRYPFQAGQRALGYSSNRPNKWYEDMGEVVFAFDPFPLGQPFNVIALARNPADAGADFRIYGYDANNLPIYDSDGSEGVLVPVGQSGNLLTPNLAGSNMVRCERIFRDQTTGYVDLWSCDESGNLIQFLATYWPDETEPKYRRIRLGTAPFRFGLNGTVSYPVVRMRYRKRWRKVTSLTDPIHLRSRKAIIEAMKAWSLSDNNQAVMAPGQGVQMERAALKIAVEYLNDEWRSMHPNEGLDIQVNEDVWPAVMNNWETMT